MKGKTKPERASWFIWSILLLIAFFAQLAEGGTWSLMLTFADLTTVLVIVVLSYRYGVGGGTKLDIFSLVGAGVGLILWYLTDQPLFAILITILIDFFAGLPTLVKAYIDPLSETFIAYFICATGALLGAFSVGENNFSLWVFPAWIATLNYAIAFAIFLGKRKLLEK